MVRFALISLLVAACSSTYAETPPKADGGATVQPSDDAATAACSGRVDCERLVFVSSEASIGKFDDGGLIGADAFCQRLADASTRARGRTFRAWLSTESTPALGRLTNGTRQYRRTDGVEVQASLGAFAQGPLKAPINVDENGMVVPTSEVWTGTQSDGAPNSRNCNEWTATTQVAEGRRGSAAMTDSAWSSRQDASCDEEARVYCFEN